MKNKDLILNRVDQVYNDIKNIKYLLNTIAPEREVYSAFDKSLADVKGLRDLLSTQPDDFNSHII